MNVQITYDYGQESIAKNKEVYLIESNWLKGQENGTRHYLSSSTPKTVMGIETKEGDLGTNFGNGTIQIGSWSLGLHKVIDVKKVGADLSGITFEYQLEKVEA